MLPMNQVPSSLPPSIPRIARRPAWHWLAGVILAVLAVACARAPEPAAPASTLAGTIRISGSPADGALLDALQKDFQARHPQVAFTQSLHGPESTLAGVYTGTADIALMARELREPMERMAFEWVLLDKPLAIEIADAAIDSDRLTTQLGVFVHRSNPLRQLSLRQLDAIYGAEHRRGDANIRRWDELGVGQDWADRSIHVHGPVVDSVQALVFRRIVLNDSRKWNPGYRQAAGEGAAVIAALAADPHGITYAPLRDATVDVKPVALAAEDGGPFVLPGADSVRNRSWPLTRSISVVTAHTKDKPASPEVRAFLRYLLSAEGQAVIGRDGGYLPLGEESLRRQRERLP